MRRLILFLAALVFIGTNGTPSQAAPQPQGTNVAGGAAGAGGGGGTPTLNNILSPTAPATFNLGAISPVLFTDPGVFTSAAQNVDLQAIITGSNANCTMANVYGSFTFTSALVGMVCDPTGSTGVTNSYSNGVIGVFRGDNTGATGQFGWVGGVGVFGSAFCYANNEHCWGANDSVTDQASQTGNVIIANENDTSVSNTATIGYAVLASMRGNAQSTNFPAFFVQRPAGTGTYTSGFQCDAGAVQTAAAGCIVIGQAGVSGVSNSLIEYFNANDGAAIQHFSQLQKSDIMFENGFPHALYNPTTANESYGIILQSGAGSLVVNELVKISTGANNTIVACTTTDTQCLGFIQNTESTNALCGNGSLFCPIAATPGNKVLGVLGTGTCAVGNYVIIDSTSVGRIQCTAAVPTSTEIIGIAIQAVVTVGNTVQLITVFQIPNTAGQFCGTTAACSATAEPAIKTAFGSAPLVTGTPSTVTITGISPAFTSNTSYKCTTNDQTTASNSLVSVTSYASGSSFVITGPATNTDTIEWICVGF